MKKNAPGCCGCGVPALAITIYGCGGLPLAGAAVVVKQGATVVASYTSSGAQHTILVPSAGVYTVEASKARFDAGSVTGTAVAGSTVPVSLTLTAAMGYRCCTTCPDPYPSTLYLDYAGRTITLTYGTSLLTGVTGWHGTTTFRMNGYRLGPYGGCISVGLIYVPFFYTLTCPTLAPGGGGLSGWKLEELVWVCGTGSSLLVTDESDPSPGHDTFRVWRTGQSFSYNPCSVPLDFDVTLSSGGITGADLDGHVSETPPTGTGTLTVTVTGCNSLPLPGATVTATLGPSSISGTTDAAGVVTLTLGAGTWSVISSLGPRFANSTPSSQTITSGGTTSLAVTMAPAVGYACIGGCVLPLKETISLLNSGFGSGAISLVHNGVGRWIGCHTISRLGKAFACTTDALVDTPVVYEFVGSDGSLVYRDRTCIASFVVYLLAGACSNTNGGPWTTSRTSFACPPSFGATYTTPNGTVTFGSPITLTLSEP